MTGSQVLWANQLLWDHLIVDTEGEPLGMVDDLELTDAGDGGGPVLTAILCGPLALGPRMGGRIGNWWTAIARRLYAADDPYPPRIPFDLVENIDARAVQVRIARDAAPTNAMRHWVRLRVIEKIPGSGS